eukprot:5702227-Amphidinium_carterae.1
MGREVPCKSVELLSSVKGGGGSHCATQTLVHCHMFEPHGYCVTVRSQVYSVCADCARYCTHHC